MNDTNEIKAGNNENLNAGVDAKNKIGNENNNDQEITEKNEHSGKDNEKKKEEEEEEEEIIILEDEEDDDDDDDQDLVNMGLVERGGEAAEGGGEEQKTAVEDTCSISANSRQNSHNSSSNSLLACLSLNGADDASPMAILPEKLSVVPVEHELSLLPSDMEYIKILSEKYKNKLTTTFAHQPELVLRFVLAHSQEKPKKRLAVTCEHIEKYMKTYEELKLNEIVNSPISEEEQKVIKSWRMYIYGVNKMGHPIIYDHLGALDFNLLQEIYARNPNTIKLAKYRFMTKLTNFKSYLSNKYGKLIYKHVMIFDMEGFTKRFMGSSSRKLCKEIVGDLSQLYPEMAYKVFVINAPSMFKSCWKVVKTFLEPVTADKVKVFGTTDMKAFFKELSLIADAEMIPPTFGGKGNFTIRLSDVPAEFTMDLSKPYPYSLPPFTIKEEKPTKK